MNTSRPAVLISGGGIAGPALAYWLHRAGFVPTIVERAAQVRAGGHRIDLGPTGLDMLTRLGLADRIGRVSGPLPTPTLVLGRHDREVTVPAQPHSVGRSASLRRGDICSAVNSLIADSVEVVYGDSITAVEQRTTHTRVSFERGHPRDFDLVVGADGINSTVRSLVFGPRERYAQFLGTNLAITAADNHLGLRDRMLLHTWPNRGLAISTFPDNTELEFSFLIRDATPVHPGRLSAQEALGYVERAFLGDRWEVPAALERVRAAADLHVAPSVQIHMPTWSAGRVALIGDAAHCPDPMSGEGTTLALAGAYVLAGELDVADGDPARAFPAYERVMRGVVEAGQQAGDAGTSMLAPATGPAGLWMRDQVMRAAVPVLRLGARLGLSLAGADKVALTLPTYAFAEPRPPVGGNEASSSAQSGH
jgi:2-polyprenyl-6-methoxyphenol hydroxylase-like FAD-dependent oxidoreductase